MACNIVVKLDLVYAQHSYFIDVPALRQPVQVTCITCALLVLACPCHLKCFAISHLSEPGAMPVWHDVT
jgi:hypothetical protein